MNQPIRPRRIPKTVTTDAMRTLFTLAGVVNFYVTKVVNFLIDEDNWEADISGEVSWERKSAAIFTVLRICHHVQHVISFRECVVASESRMCLIERKVPRHLPRDSHSLFGKLLAD